MRYQNIISLVLFLVINISCMQDSVKEKSIDFNGIAHVKICNQHSDSAITSQVRYIDLLLQKWIKSESISIRRNDTSILSFTLHYPAKVKLNVNSQWFDVYLSPNDTLSISVVSENNNFGLKFNENEFSYQDNIYLQNKANLTDFDFSKDVSSLYKQNLNSNDFKRSIDSLTQIELAQLNKSFQNKELSKHLYEYERANVHYSTLHFKSTYSNWNKAYKNRTLELDENYYNYLNNIDLLDINAKYNSMYYMFLSLYYNQEFPSDEFKFSRNSNKEMIKYIKGNFDLADKYLNGEIRDIYKFRKLYNALTGGFKVGTYQYYKSYNKIFEDPKFDTYLLTLLNQNDYKLSGTEAVNFYAFDSDSLTISFNQFKNKVVLLEFFTPGCYACKNEIHYEGELVQELGDKNFEFVSICLTNRFETYIAFLDAYNKPGLSVFTNKNWRGILSDKYLVNSYPHYVLIDKNGNVVENNCKRPSQDIITDIKKLL